MLVLDTDTVSLLEHGNERVSVRLGLVTQEVVTTTITRIEILQGRFASILKAADGGQLLLAQQRLEQSESRLRTVRILPIDEVVAAEFNLLRDNKKLKKLGRADLLIASIALANQATLVTRNLKDFRLVPGLQMENWAD
jgi:tRNA(fMet)-specific endonuclease VapC